MKQKLTGESTSTPGLLGVSESRQRGQHSLRAATKTTSFRPLPSSRQAQALRAWSTVAATVALLVTLVTACTNGTSASPTNPPTTVLETNGVVVRVVDGDTVKIALSGKTESVRLIGIDTPETVDPKRPIGCYGNEASAFTKQLLPKDTPVRVVLDVEARDRYKRMLGYVYRSTDGMFINAEIAAKGYANVLTIPPNVAHQEEFVRLVAEARTQNIGLWGTCGTDVPSAGKG